MSAPAFRILKRESKEKKPSTGSGSNVASSCSDPDVSAAGLSEQAYEKVWIFSFEYGGISRHAQKYLVKTTMVRRSWILKKCHGLDHQGRRSIEGWTTVSLTRITCVFLLLWFLRIRLRAGLFFLKQEGTRILHFRRCTGRRWTPLASRLLVF